MTNEPILTLTQYNAIKAHIEKRQQEYKAEAKKLIQEIDIEKDRKMKRNLKDLRSEFESQISGMEECILIISLLAKKE